ncbi:MAG: hypothetical protein R3F56_06860 [Planctomycetota bacterium]
MEDEKYGDLLRQKGFRGFPTLAFMDAEGEVLTSKVSRAVPAFRRTAAVLATVAELSKADKEGKLEGDAAAKLLLARIDLGEMDLARATERRNAIKGPLSEASKQSLSERITDLEVAAIVDRHQQEAMPKRNELMQALRTKPGGEQPTAEQRREVSSKLAAISSEMTQAVATDLQAIVDSGRKPSDDGALSFWSYLLRDGTMRKDAKAIEDAKAALTALAERRPDLKHNIERMLNPQAAVPGRVIPATPLRAPAAEPKKTGSGKKDGGE